MHFNHTNVITYCLRNFRTVDEMNEALIKNWNDVVKEDDTVFHLGDFCFRGEVRPEEWIKKLNGRIVFIKGNHDDRSLSIIRSIEVKFANMKVLLIHDPDHAPLLSDYHLVLCGHVHRNWKFKIGMGGVPFINVGVDVWNYRPVKIDEVIDLTNKLKRI